MNNPQEEFPLYETKSERIKKGIIKYTSAIIIGLGIVVLALFIRDFINTFNAYKEYVASGNATEASKTLQTIYLYLADAFTFPGMLFILTGCLIALSNQGALHGVGYAVTHMFKMLIPGKKKAHETYADYIASKNPVRGYSYIFFTGLGFMTIAVVFIILFYNI